MSQNTFKIKNYILVFFVLFLSHMFAQESESGNVINDLTVNLEKGNGGASFTGDLQFSMPILTVPGRNGLDYTIYLDYNSAVRARQQASWVGLGFNVNIGKVTRSVVNRIDDQHSIMFQSPTTYDFNLGNDDGSTETIEESTGMLWRGDDEYEAWDLYNLLLPNESSRIVPRNYLDGQSWRVKFETTVWKPWLINYNYDDGGIAHNDGSGYDEQFIQNFGVTKDDGTQYLFKHLENLNINNNVSGDSKKYIEFPVAWGLTQITSSDYLDLNSNGPDDSDYGSWINITYNDYAVESNALDYSMQQNIKVGTKTYGGVYSSDYAHLNYDYSRVSTVETPTHKAVFYSNDGTGFFSSNTPAREPERLDYIDLVRKADNKTIKRISFVYATNTNDQNGSWESNEKLKNNCLTLIGIEEKDNITVPVYTKPKMQFKYYNNPYISNWQAISNLGYHTGAFSAWSLSEIEFAEGGKINYAYEYDDYNWFYNLFDTSVLTYKTYYDSNTRTGYGTRIKSVSLNDGSNTKTWNYDYGQGILTYPNVTSSTQLYVNDANKFTGSIGYRNVTITLPDNKGKIINYYTSGINTVYSLYTNSAPLAPAEEPSEKEAYSSEFELETIFYSKWIDRDAGHGFIWKSEFKDISNNIVKSVQSNYSIVSSANQGPTELQGICPSYVTQALLTQKIEEIDGVENYTNYEYNSTNGLPKKITRMRGDGRSELEVITYAFEQPLTFGMKEYRNMISQVGQRWIFDTWQGSGNVIAGDFTTYKNLYSNFPTRWVKDEYSVIKDDRENSDYSGDDLLLDTKYLEYDKYGNVTQSQDGVGNISSFKYGHKGSELIAKAENTEGQTILFDNFSDNSFISDPFTWTITGSWTCTDEQLNSSYTDYAGIHAYSFQFFNADVQLKILDDNNNPYNWAAIHFGSTSTDVFNTGYLLFYRSNGNLTLYSQGTSLYTINTGILPNVWRKLSLKVYGAEVTAFIDGKEIFSYTNSSTIPSGYLSLYTYKTETLFDNFRVYPEDALMQNYSYDASANISEMIDYNNNSKYFTFDGFNRLTSASELIEGEKALLKSHIYSFSREDNNDDYDASNPNKTETLLYSDAGIAPASNVNYSNGLGKEIQSKQLNNNKTIVSLNNLYDANGNIIKSFMPYELNSSSMAYDASYLTNAIAYNTNAGNYPFSENDFLDNPLNRMDKVSSPGLWRMNSGHEVEFDYGTNSTAIDEYYADNLYKLGTTNEQEQLVETYTDKLGNKVLEVVDPSGLNLQTRFYYDLAGQVTQITDPRGLVSSYSYNSLDQLTEKSTPDAGTEKYLYDEKGNLRFIRHADQVTSSHNTSRSYGYIYSPTTKTGSFSLVTPTMLKVRALASGGPDFPATTTIKIKSSSNNFLFLEVEAESGGNTDVTKYYRLPVGSYSWEVVTTGFGPIICYYDVDTRNNMEFEYNKYDDYNRIVENGEHYYYYSSSDAFTQTNADDGAFPSSGKYLYRKYYYDVAADDAVLVEQQRNLKGKLSYSLSYHLNALAFTTFYSYNDQGDIEWIVNKWVTGKNDKIKYEYDLQRRITQIDFIGDHSSYDYYKFFEYDDIGRLTNVYTADNSGGTNKTKEAEYEYYADGSVKRMELGAEGNKAQGVDYIYNERGWLTQINHQNLNSSDDPGGDGANGIPLDKFGMVIGYDNVSGHITNIQNTTAQWSGNISWLMYKMYGVTSGGSLVGNTYTYDNANRLKESDFGYYSGGWLTTNNYDVKNITYDDNGNTTAIQRYWNSGSLFDNQVFEYNSNTNQLNQIRDYATSSISTTDIDYQNADNYIYDDNGNMIQDEQQGIGFILYNVHNMPIKMYYTNGDVIEYIYDVNGNRVTKKVEDDNILWNYAYGANGNVEARIKENGNPPTHIKHNLWGNDLVGIREYISYYSTTDEKFYYLKDHLGSIKVRVDENGIVAGYDDYYPFGMVMNGRSGSTGSEEDYKFTGKERDTETGLDYFGARYYDSKIGRWMSVDPLADKYPGWSPYNYVSNNPLRLVDKDGREGDDYTAAMYANKENLSAEGKASFSKAYETVSEVGAVLFGGAVAVLKYGYTAGGFIAANAPRINKFVNSAIESVTPGPSNKISKVNTSLAANPFKGKSPTKISKILTKKGFKQKGSNPTKGKGSYIHPKSKNSYYIDPGGQTFKKTGKELPHVDVNIPKGTNATKRKYPLGEKLNEK